MAYYIALDAGGTKTETIVHDAAGHILFRSITPGCNAMDLGTEETCRRAESALAAASKVIPGQKPARAFCGIASMFYYGAALTTPLNRRFPDWQIHWEDDGWGMISSMLGRRDGCCIVCGTGSCLFARVGQTIHHIGGWGYLLDTCGSGYNLGRAALRAAMRQADGRGEKTLLYDLVVRQLGKTPAEGIPEIYAGGRPYIASFAHTVFEACKQGDAAARAIFDNGAQELAHMTRAAERCYANDFDVVMSGGIFAAYPEYAQAVAQQASPRAHMLYANVPPVYGCALENALADGLEDEAAFRVQFMADYKRACIEAGTK